LVTTTTVSRNRKFLEKHKSECNRNNYGPISGGTHLQLPLLVKYKKNTGNPQNTEIQNKNTKTQIIIIV